MKRWITRLMRWLLRTPPVRIEVRYVPVHCDHMRIVEPGRLRPDLHARSLN